MLVNKAVLDDLYRGLKSNFQDGFGAFEPKWNKIATMINSTSASEIYNWLGDWPQMREWIGDRRIKQLEAHGYTIRNRKFESTIKVMRDDIEDDSIGIVAPKVQSLGQIAAEHPDQLIFELLASGFVELCYDGQPFFDAEHPVGDGLVSNLQAGSDLPWFLLDTRRPLKPLIYQKRRDYQFRALNNLEDQNAFMRDEFLFGVDARSSAGFGFWQMAYGSRAALTAENFKLARAAMKKFEGDEGRKLNVNPNVIVVGPGNLDAAETLFATATLANGAGNTLYKAVEIIESTLLD